MAETVTDARQRLAYVLDDYVDELAEVPAVKAAIDQLIAAVRAEYAPPTIEQELAKLKTVMGAVHKHFGS
jgi:hypothetical protein